MSSTTFYLFIFVTSENIVTIHRANCEKSEFGLKERKSDIKKCEKKETPTPTPAPTLTPAPTPAPAPTPRFTDTPQKARATPRWSPLGVKFKIHMGVPAPHRDVNKYRRLTNDLFRTKTS